MFGARLPLAEAYADALAQDGVLRGLIGPREAPRLWERHLLNCVVLGDLITEGADVCDVGSGAGLPGLVLAVRRPDLRITLVEPLQRRCDFLSEVVERLDLPQVRVRRARAEQLHGEVDFAVVTSRAVAPLPPLLAWSMPLVRPGGLLLAMKGSSAQTEVQAAAPDLRRWRAGEVEVLSVETSGIGPPTTVVRASAQGPSRLGWNPSGSGPGDGTTTRRRRKGR